MSNTTEIQRNLSGSLLNEQQVASYINISVSTLRKDRQNNAGIAYVKRGHRVLYRPEHVEAYIEKNTVYPY